MAFSGVLLQFSNLGDFLKSAVKRLLQKAKNGAFKTEWSPIRSVIKRRVINNIGRPRH